MKGQHLHLKEVVHITQVDEGLTQAHNHTEQLWEGDGRCY